MRKIVGYKFKTIHLTTSEPGPPDHYHKLSDGWEPFGSPVVLPLCNESAVGHKAVMQLLVKYETPAAPPAAPEKPAAKTETTYFRLGSYKIRGSAKPGKAKPRNISLAFGGGQIAANFQPIAPDTPANRKIVAALLAQVGAVETDNEGYVV